MAVSRSKNSSGKMLVSVPASLQEFDKVEWLVVSYRVAASVPKNCAARRACRALQH